MKRIRGKSARRAFGGVGAMLFGLGAAVALWEGWVPVLSNAVLETERAWMDRVSALIGTTPEREDFVFLGIDSASLELTAVSEDEISGSEVLPLMRERWPWDRRVWAAAIERLGEAGARMIVLDLLVGEPSGDPGADEAMAEAIAKYRERVILAADWGPMGIGLNEEEITTLVEPLPEFLGGPGDETSYGFVNYWADPRDGVVRETYYRISKNEVQMEPRLKRHPDEQVYESIAAVMGRRLGAIPADGPHRLRFAVHGRDGRRRVETVYAPMSIYEVFAERSWESKFKGGDFFRDKVVLIGPAAPRFHDLHATPAGMITGAQLHLQSLGCLLAGRFLMEAPAYWHWAALAGMAFLGALLVNWVRNPLAVTAAAGGLLVAWMIGVLIIANETSVLSGGVAGVLGLAGVVTTGEAYEFLLERMQRVRLHTQLSRSVSRDVADAMVRSPDGYLDAARGGRRQIVVLFADVRNFTERSEREEPEALVEQLNEYLSHMVEVVFRHGGTLDKFIGDALMVSWGGLEDFPPRVMARAAMAAAREMRNELERLNERWRQAGVEPFEAGIGIHIGEAVVGEIGSRERSDFTAVGDAVNLASRIEGMTKILGVPVLVSGEFVRAVGNCAELCPLGRFRVKGRHEPVEIAGAFIEDAEAFGVALARLGEGDFVAAEGVLLELSGKSAVEGPARFYLQQLEVWKSVTREDWDGVVTLDSK